MPAAGVAGLSNQESGERPRSGFGLDACNRVRQILVEVSSLKQSHMTEVAFVKNVVVVGVFRLESRIAHAYRMRIHRVVRHADGSGNVRGVGAGESTAIDQPKGRGFVQPKSQRSAGSNTKVRGAVFRCERSWRCREAAVVAECVDMGGFKSEAGNKADWAG